MYNYSTIGQAAFLSTFRTASYRSPIAVRNESLVIAVPFPILGRAALVIVPLLFFLIAPFSLSQPIVNSRLNLRPQPHNLRIYNRTCQHYHLQKARRAAHSPAKGNICDATKPATPFSRSHHQKRFGNPAHHAVFLPLPVAPSCIVSMNVSPHPCGCSSGCG